MKYYEITLYHTWIGINKEEKNSMFVNYLYLNFASYLQKSVFNLSL